MANIVMQFMDLFNNDYGLFDVRVSPPKVIDTEVRVKISIMFT